MKRIGEQLNKLVKRHGRAAKKIGLKPGALVYLGKKKVEDISIRVIDYDATNLTERYVATIEECFPFKESPTVTWINIYGLHDVDLIAKLGKHFGIHELVLEDVINTGHRPKFEETEGYIFSVLKMLSIDGDGKSLASEQFSVVFSKTTVLTFQERPGDVLEPVRERLRKTKPRVRFMGADYLAYALVDTIVDHYFVILEQFSERIEVLEEELVSHPEPGKLEEIYALKRQLIAMRKAVWPLREVVSGLDRTESPLVRGLVRPYLRDLYEHVIHVIDSVETLRDMVSGLLDMYMSSVSNRMNEVMKVLTIIATIFIPLGFLAGVYGMNFNTEASAFNMPELAMRYGYPMFWVIAVAITGGLLWFFRRKGWL